MGESHCWGSPATSPRRTLSSVVVVCLPRFKERVCGRWAGLVLAIRAAECTVACWQGATTRPSLRIFGGTTAGLTLADWASAVALPCTFCGPPSEPVDGWSRFGCWGLGTTPSLWRCVVFSNRFGLCDVLRHLFSQDMGGAGDRGR